MPLPFIAAIGSFIKGLATIAGGYIGGATSGVLQALGVSAAAANAIGGAVSTGVYYGSQALVYVGISSALTPDVPRPEAAPQNRKQTLPPRVKATGRVRLGGPYMLLEAKANKLYVVIALHDGQISAFVNFYLNDDKGAFADPATADLLGINASDVVLTYTGGDGRYGALAASERVKLYFNTGLPTETAFADIVADLTADDIWTTNHRGDGSASAGMICKHGDLEDFPTHFPNGIPELSVVADTQFVPDPREPGFDPADQGTWVYNANPVCALMLYELVEMGADWNTVFAPTLDLWIAAMDVCDEAVALDAGGTEHRYSHGARFDTSNAPADVRRQYLSCFDGWMGENGSGAKTIYAGKYVAPTIDAFALVESGGEIFEYSYQEFTEDERAVNELVISYTSPEHDYNEVEADPWRDDETYDAGRGRPEQFSLPWVQSPTQARRLAKRKMAKLKAAQWSITCNLAGLRALGHRFIPLLIEDGDLVVDAVGEVSNIEIDILALRVTISGVIADTTVDSWTPATEEGNPPPAVDPSPGEALAAPTITAAVAVAAAGGTKIEVTGTYPSRDDLQGRLQWRTQGTTVWTPEAFQAIAGGAGVKLLSGLVTTGANIEVQASYRTGAGAVSPWSATSTVTVSASGGGFDSLGVGLIAHTAAGNNYAVRTITAGGSITVTNGDGAAGNPTIALSSTPAIGAATGTSLTATAGVSGGSLRATGFSPAGSGAGLEGHYSAGVASIWGYDRTGGAHTAMKIGHVTAGIAITNAGVVSFPGVGTTAGAANAVLDGSDVLLKSTSSARYKSDIEPMDLDRALAILEIAPVWYRSRAPADRADWSWYGFTAEAVAAIEPRLATWTDIVGYREEKVRIEYIGEDSKGRRRKRVATVPNRVPIRGEPRPDGVQYDRFTAAHQLLLQELFRRDEDKEARIAALEKTRA